MVEDIGIGCMFLIDKSKNKWHFSGYKNSFMDNFDINRKCLS